MENKQKNCMTTSESKGRSCLLQKRIDSHNKSNQIDSNRELECSKSLFPENRFILVYFVALRHTKKNVNVIIIKRSVTTETSYDIVHRYVSISNEEKVDAIMSTKALKILCN